jgi:hypothetical protein
MTSLTLILLLVIPGDARFVAATADGGIAQLPVVGGDGSWLRIRMNLSGSHDVVSGYPDIAMSDDGNYVAVVWTEGYKDVFVAPEAKHRGRVYLRWVSEGTGIWSSKITVDDGANTANDYAIDASVVLQGTTAHIVWVRVQNASNYSIKYAKCFLFPGGTCEVRHDPLSSSSSALSSSDIAVDGSGNVFVVWSSEAIPYREIRYGQFNGSSWSVEPISENNTINDWPTVAVRNGTVYTAWIKTVITQGVVVCREKSASGSWTNPPAERYTPSSSRYPRLTAGSSAVYLVWETLQTGSFYQFGYKYNTGTGWQPSLPNERKGIPATDSIFSASTSGAGMEEYGRYLRPALALDGAGHLYAVWHHYDSGEDGSFLHRVLYSCSDNPTAVMPTWTDWKVFATLSADERLFSQDNVSARIAVGGTGSTCTDPNAHVHVVLMLKNPLADNKSAWEVWYLSNQLYKSVSLPMVTKNW